MELPNFINQVKNMGDACNADMLRESVEDRNEIKRQASDILINLDNFTG